MSKLRSLLTPPVFADADLTRQARVLHMLALYLTLTLAGVGGLGSLFIFPVKFASGLVSLLGVGVVVIVVYLNHRGQVAAAARFFLVMYWLTITALVCLSQGMRSLDIMFYISGTLIAGVTLGTNGALAFGGLSTLTGLVMILLSNTGLVVFPNLFPFPDRSGWVLLVINLSMTIIPLNVALNLLAEALAQARSELTERHHIEAALQRRIEQLNSLNHISQSITQVHDLKTVLDLILTPMQMALPLDTLYVALYDAATQEVKVALLFDAGQRWPETHAPLTPGTWSAQVILERESLLINRTAAEIAAQRLAGSDMVGDTQRVSASLMFVPMLIGEKSIGMVSAQSYTLNAYDDNDLAFLGNAANQIAIAVENARLYEALQSELLERQRAETDLQRAETIYRQAISGAGAVPYYRDYRIDDHAYTFMGEGILAITGYSATELTPATFDTICLESVMRGSLAHLTYEEGDRLSGAGQIRHWECDYRILTRDGQTRWVADSAVQVRDKNDARIGVVGILQDITDRKLAEARVRQREALFEAVTFTAGLFLQTADWRASLPRALERLGQTLQASHAYLFELHLSPAREWLRSMRSEWVAPGQSPDLPKAIYQNVPLAAPPFAAAYARMRQGEPFIGHTVSLAPAEKAALAERGFTAWLEVPVFVEGQWWGIIGFDECVAPRQWASAEVEVLKVAAQVLGAAIQRQQAEAAVHRSEELHRRAVEAAGAVPYVIDYAADRYSFMGTAIEQLTGYPAAGFTPKQWEALVEEFFMMGEAALVDRRLASNLAVAGQLPVWRADNRIHTQAGEVRWVHDAAVEIINPATGQSTGAIGILQDITERKQAEAALEKRNQQLAALNAIGRTAAMLTDLPTTLDKLLKTLQTILTLDVFYVGLYQPETNDISYPLFYDSGELWEEANSALEEGTATFQVIQTRQPLLINRTPQQIAERLQSDNIMGDSAKVSATLMLVPLVLGEQVVGLISVQSYQSEAYAAEDLTLLTSAAYQVAVAIENARLFEALQASQTQIQHRADQLASLNQIARMVSALTDLDSTLRNTFSEIQRVLALDVFWVALYDVEQDRVSFPFLYDSGQVWQEPATPIQKDSWVAQVARTREPFLLLRTPAEMKASSDDLIGDRSRVSASVMVVPLLIGERVVGAISAQSYTLNAYTTEQVALLTGAAYQVAIAIENARLFTAMQQELAERQKAESALRVSEERYRLISAISSDYVFAERVAEDGKSYMEWVSGAFETITGYTSEEFMARGGWSSLLHPDDVAIDERDFAALTANRPVETEVRIIRKTGEVRWVRAYAQPLWDVAHNRLLGIYGAVQDITARKEADLTLERYADRLEMLHEIDHAILAAHSPEETAIAALTRLRRLIPCVRASINLFDFQKRTSVLLALDTDLATYLPVGVPVAFEEYGLEVIAHLRAGETYFVNDTTTTTVDRQMAQEGIRSWLIIPLHYQQELIGAVNLGGQVAGHFTPEHAEIAKSVANPVAIMVQQNRLLEAVRQANVELEARVEARTEELRVVNAALARAARLKDEFLASMSHELRTPLTGILAFAQTLQKPKVYGELNAKQLKAAKSIEDSGKHLLELINDVLDLSKIEAGKLELEPSQVMVEEVCQASLRLVKQLAATRRQSISYTLQPLDLFLTVDVRRLKQMLVNLLSNAVKFTPEGGALGLEVVGDSAHQVVRFTVWDNGIGIAPENLPRLFQSFVQLDARLSREYSGTGLGLALVRRMTELHGGSVSVVSELGQGSRFTITLPLAAAVATAFSPTPAAVGLPAIAGEAALLALGVAPAPARLRILLAEDNEVNIQVLTDYLEASGYTLTVARTGSEAVRRAQTEHPQVILMDIQMPGMDGLEATRLIRQDPALARVPILALTALAMPGDRERCLAAGANAYLTKPVNLEHLTELIRVQLKAV